MLKEVVARSAEVEVVARSAKVEVVARSAKLEVVARSAKLEVVARSAEVEVVARSAEVEVVARSAEVDLYHVCRRRSSPVLLQRSSPHIASDESFGHMLAYIRHSRVHTRTDLGSPQQGTRRSLSARPLKTGSPTVLVYTQVVRLSLLLRACTTHRQPFH